MLTSIEKVRRKVPIREMKRIATTWEPLVMEAFLKAARMVRDQVVLKAMVDAIKSGNVELAIDLSGAAKLGQAMRGVGLPPGEKSVNDYLMEAFQSGAVMGALQLPKEAGLKAALDLTNPESVRYMREHLPLLIREITNDQRRMVRSLVLEGFTEKVAPIDIARQVRDVVGLTELQGRAVINFRRQLETGEMGSGKAPWDRRLSGPEQAQARNLFEAEAPNQAKVDAIVARYEQSLINRRALDIAGTEVHTASIQGQRELWDQAQTDGLLDPSKTRRFWLDTKDDRERDEHLAVPGMNPNGVGLDEPFQTPIGPVMDPGTSGVASFDINCRCAVGLGFI